VKFDKKERDRYALVVFLDLYPKAMFVFSKGLIKEVCKRLGKRHQNQEFMLQFTVSDYRRLMANRKKFEDLGVQVFEDLI
jgi:hypothetical protein